MTTRRSESAYRYIQAHISTPLVEDPGDAIDAYFDNWRSKRRGTLMPPSPGAEKQMLDIQYDSTNRLLMYTSNVKWRPITLWLARRMPRFQLKHRSRGAILAMSPLQITEQEKKIYQVQKWYDKLRDVTLSPSKSETIFRLFIGRVIECMTFDASYIRKYIKDHESRSLGQGWKWRDLKYLSDSELKVIFDLSVGMLEQIQSHPGMMANVIWNTGMRARPDPIKGDDITVGQHGVITRSRIVQFMVSMSIHNMGLTDKPAMLKKYISELESIVQPRGNYTYPMLEGGQVYLTASDMFSTAKSFHAYDGKNWESCVAIILGKAFRPFMFRIGGLDMLPSGSFATTFLGTTASVINSRNLGGDFIVHGDDLNAFNLDRDPNQPWLELSHEDSAAKMILGVGYHPDIHQPRTYGLKAQSDRADKAIPFQLDSNNTAYSVVHGKATPQEVSLWIGLYLGYYGDGTLLEALRKETIQHRDYFAPSELLDQMIRGKDSDKSFTWAESENVKKIITEK